MLKTKHEKGMIIFFYAFSAVLMVIASFYDLQIDQYVYSPDNFFGIFFDRIGELPPFLAVAFSCMILYRFPPIFRRWATVLTKIIFGLGTIAAWIYIYYDFVDKWISNFEYRRIIEVIFGIITGLICLYFSKYIPEEHKRSFKSLAVFFILVSLLTPWSTNELKDIWGRLRFRQLVEAGSFDGFTPWYTFGPGDGRSFPSGHTTAAAATFMLMGISYFFPSQKKNELKYFIIAFVFTFTVGFSRLVRGAHFLSDITFAAIIVFTVFLIIRYLYVKKPISKRIKAYIAKKAG